MSPTDNTNIRIKLMEQPDIKEFERLLDQAQKWAKENNLKDKNIQDAIKTVRRRKKEKS